MLTVWMLTRLALALPAPTADMYRVVLLPPGWPTQVEDADPSTWHTPDQRFYVCNDGTLPVYYYAPGTGSGVDKWFIFLEGGGSCDSPEECRERAQFDASGGIRNRLGTGCVDSDTCGDYGVYDLSTSPFGVDLDQDPALSIETSGFDQATNAGVPPVKSFGGLFAPPIGTDVSPFSDATGTWNRVWVNYCSSDSWTGDARPPNSTKAGMAPTLSQARGDLPVLRNAYLQYVVGVGADEGYDPTTDQACNPPGAPSPNPLLATCPTSPWCTWGDSGGVEPDRACSLDSIFFNGHAIVDHLIDTMQGGFDYDAPCDPADPEGLTCSYTSFALQDATTVVFGGGSAGAKGAYNNVDFVGEKIQGWPGVADPLDYRGYFDSLWGTGRMSYFEDGETGPDLSEWVRGEWSDGGILRSLYHSSFVDADCAPYHNADATTMDPLTYAAAGFPQADSDCTDIHTLTYGNFMQTPHFFVQNFWDQVLRDDSCLPPGEAWGDDQNKACFSELLEYSGWYMPTLDSNGGWYLGRLEKHVMVQDDKVYPSQYGWGHSVDASDHESDGSYLAERLANWLGEGPTRSVDDRTDDDVVPALGLPDVTSLIDPLNP